MHLKSCMGFYVATESLKHNLFATAQTDFDDDTRNICGQCRSRSDGTERAV